MEKNRAGRYSTMHTHKHARRRQFKRRVHPDEGTGWHAGCTSQARQVVAPVSCTPGLLLYAVRVETIHFYRGAPWRGSLICIPENSPGCDAPSTNLSRAVPGRVLDHDEFQGRWGGGQRGVRENSHQAGRFRDLMIARRNRLCRVNDTVGKVGKSGWGCGMGPSVEGGRRAHLAIGRQVVHATCQQRDKFRL